MSVEMHPEMVKRMALHACMVTGFRYLDTLNGYVTVYQSVLPSEFVAEVRRDFAEYSEKMRAAGLSAEDFSLKLQDGA